MIKRVSVEETKKLLMGNEEIIILDVRTSGEFDEGHIDNVINRDILKDDFKEQIGKLDKNKTYLIYCRTDNRSDGALKVMVEQGFENIYQMLGGFEEW